MKKETSTHALNHKTLSRECGMYYTLSLIGGRWKLSILSVLLDNKKLRYNEVKTAIPDITERMLIKQLKELETDGLINRIVFHQVPPRVEYELTATGLSLKQILTAMGNWGDRQMNTPAAGS